MKQRIFAAALKKAFLLSLTLLIFVSCSSVPKKPLEVFDERNKAANQLDLANRIANQGMYEDALIVLDEARRLAVSTDDSPLLIKTDISRGNILFSLGSHDEAFRHWDAALDEGISAGQNDLAALARIFSARGRLVLLLNSGEKNGIEEIRNEVNKQIGLIAADEQARAAGYVVLGMAEKELGSYGDAEKSLRRAVEIHEKNRYLEETAYDWFFLASIFSVWDKHDQALEALTTAINFDRRAENGFGLASDWQAMGEVYQKMNRPADSVRAYNRAAEIYRSIGLDSPAEKAEAKARSISGG